MPKILKQVGLLILLIALTYAYLYPGSAALFQGRTDIVMSDDTDGATLPFAYDGILKTFHNHPSYLLYGSVYVANYDPEFGMGHWMPWNERWSAILFSYFVPLEQISTAMVFLLFILNASAMYVLCRYLKWSTSISGGLAIAWAFCSFTRARAKVHMAMAGTYHLPLIFLGILFVSRGRSRRSLAAAAVSFLLATTVVHYFITTSMFLSPAFLLFFAIQPEVRANIKRKSLRLILALLPSILFLAFNFAFPLPSAAKISRDKALPEAGQNINGRNHPFLYYFAAKPIDYLGGDISLHESAIDPNPLRQSVNEYILSHLDQGNSHERSNGIRWSIILLSVIAVASITLRRFRSEPKSRANLLYFLFFGALGFWLSIGPDIPFNNTGLSYWLHELVPQVRVPSRAGICVHFALLMITGIYLESNFRWRWLLFPGVFPFLMVLEYPPLFQDMTMSSVRPAIVSLQRERGACGAGIYFPFVNLYSANDRHYQFLQRMRGSDCAIINTLMSPIRLTYLMQKFPAKMDFISKLPFDSQTPRELERLARCVPFTWIVFDSTIDPSWREKMCAQLGWTMNPDLSCVARDHSSPLQRFPDECG